MSAAPKSFTTLAPRIMRDLIRDLDIRPRASAACLGNIGHECNGFRTMQEVKPTVPGSRGGYGWGQWTGPRRRAFELWCKERRLKPASYEANYSFLIHELHTSHQAALRVLRADHPLEVLVELFEHAFLRAGVKHMDSRIRYARWAVEAFDSAKGANPKPLGKSRTLEGAATAGAGQAVQQEAQPIGEAIKQGADTLSPHVDAVPALGVIVGWVAAIGVALTLFGLARVAWARWDDAGRPLPAWWPFKAGSA